MTDDLIKRLRSVDVSWSQAGEWCAEAADTIEAQAAEIARLREALEEWIFLYHWRVDGMPVEQARTYAQTQMRMSAIARTLNPMPPR